MKVRALRSLGAAITMATVLAAILAAPAAAEVLPNITIKPASAIEPTEATLNGSVARNGHVVEYKFEWGTTTAYGSASEHWVEVSGYSSHISAVLTGLEPHQTYHFRLITLSDLEEEEGVRTIYSDDETFTAEAHHPRFEASEYPVTLSGEQDSPNGQSIEIFNGASLLGKLSCETVNYAEEEEEFASQATDLALYAEYSACAYNVGIIHLPTNVKMNSCRYTLGLLDSGPPYAGTLGIACDSEGDAIEAVVYQSEKKREAEESWCTFKIDPQEGREGVSLGNTGEGNEERLALDLEVGGIEVIQAGPGCGESQPRTAAYNGGMTVYGYSWSGGQNIPMYVSGLNDIGLNVTHSGLEAEYYPTTVQGEQDPANALTFDIGSGVTTCEAASVTATLLKPSSSLPSEAAYSGCLTKYGILHLQTEIVMNSCHYVLNFLSGGPPYGGTMGVACNKGGDAVEDVVYQTKKKQEEGIPLCTYVIEPQSGLGGVTFANVGEGNSESVSAELDVEGVEYTSEGYEPTCGKSSGTASYSGGMILHGNL